MPHPKKSKIGSGDCADDGQSSVSRPSDRNVKLEKNENSPLKDPSEDQESSEESEDDKAVLLTEKVENKIFETILNIRNKNPEIYDKNHVVFNDSDFENDDAETTNSSSKAYTYGDMLRKTLIEEGAEAFERDEEDSNVQKCPSYVEVQEALKKEFLSAACAADGEDDLFKKIDSAEVLSEGAKAASMSNRQRSVRENELISRYWSSERELDEDEEFLKDYILNQRWREDRSNNFDYLGSFKGFDAEDEKHVERAEEFEHNYNYRFEEEGGSNIIGHPRNIEGSVRKVDDRRRKKRLELKQRRLERKKRRDEELKHLKNLKKSEIEERIREISAKASVNLSGDVADPKTPFYPQKNKENVANIPGLDYERKDDKGQNRGDYCYEDDPNTWWLCDHCQEGVPAGEKHYDCRACDNYTLCKRCMSIANHEHTDFVCKTVPPQCGPPLDGDEVAEISKMMDDYYSLDYEDFVGNSPVRFKYRKVEPFGFDLKTILEKTDAELNAMAPLHKLIGYDSHEDIKKSFKKPHKRETGLKNSSNGDSSRRAKFSGKRTVDRRMTEYNVNRDRLLAFGVVKNDKKRNKAGR